MYSRKPSVGTVPGTRRKIFVTNDSNANDYKFFHTPLLEWGKNLRERSFNGFNLFFRTRDWDAGDLLAARG